MTEFLRKHMRTIFIITIVGFMAGAFVGFGSYFFGKKSVTDAVAEINGKKISYRDYTMMYNRTIENLRNAKEEVNEETMQRKKQEVLQDMIQEEVFWQEARKHGISVTDAELASNIQRYPAFQKEGKFDQQAYFQVVFQVLRTTPNEFEESQRRQIAIAKLRQMIADSVKISEPEIQFEYARANKGNMKKFNDERAKFLEGLRQEKVMMVFNEWFKQLNKQVKIKVYLEEIEKNNV
ncbi:MAG: hypothetical protein A2219_07645 [Elusimicrobia bacterium RIFOXYA2_FULL_50_26]|nr:MAG: hypothetical protein A2219_07645 [Elusimicrobia bacterium RIFOXYA2_FULL_50_26]